MERSWWTKFLFLVAVTVFSILYVIPTLGRLDPEKTNFPFTKKINLGLDLQGGLYLVLGVDFKKVYRETVDRQLISLKERASKEGITLKKTELVTDGQPDDDPKIVLEYDNSQAPQLKTLLEKEFFNLRRTADQAGRVELGLLRDQRDQIREKTIDQSIEIIRNRIDQFGVSEPSIMSQGNDRVIVELPGVREIDRAKELIGRTAKLEFRIVQDKKMEPGAVAEMVSKIEQENNIQFKEGGNFSDYVDQINKAAKGKVPEGTEIAFERVEGLGGQVLQRIPYLLSGTADVTGDHLMDARVQFNQETQSPEVGFSFNATGAVKFGKLTGDHIRERLAIVLDGIVYSAPVIQSQIRDQGVITLGRTNGEEAVKEAKDLAIVLRAGALPAKLEFMEQRVVGSQLGEDSIKAGTRAGLIGVILVFIFTIIYYRVSGVIAVISLLLNVLFVLATLVGLEATLTMPGIAGIALTVGIAVDSNIIIYERIREEYLSGKSIGGSIEAGFQKAFRSIMDSNVTNAAAAVVLMNFGTGPIKGFAVTFLIGIITTLFTAVFVCRLLFDVYLARLEKKPDAALSI